MQKGAFSALGKLLKVVGGATAKRARLRLGGAAQTLIAGFFALHNWCKDLGRALACQGADLINGGIEVLTQVDVLQELLRLCLGVQDDVVQKEAGKKALGVDQEAMAELPVDATGGSGRNALQLVFCEWTHVAGGCAFQDRFKRPGGGVGLGACMAGR